MLLPPEKAHSSQTSGLRTDRTPASQYSQARSEVIVPLANLTVGSLGMEQSWDVSPWPGPMAPLTPLIAQTITSLLAHWRYPCFPGAGSDFESERQASVSWIWLPNHLVGTVTSGCPFSDRGQTPRPQLPGPGFLSQAPFSAPSQFSVFLDEHLTYSHLSRVCPLVGL